MLLLLYLFLIFLSNEQTTLWTYGDTTSTLTCCGINKTPQILLFTLLTAINYFAVSFTNAISACATFSCRRVQAGTAGLTRQFFKHSQEGIKKTETGQLTTST
jgi:hypothetical protein